ncbi:MAG TPA: hypothetical protein VJY33_16285, partial [Isosphaeraceae bacterium]|nr:hypothetical protein [Isosphaeraceae bacterium]
MKKFRVLLIMAVLSGTFLASSRSLLSYMQPPPPPDAGGCDMQFLFSRVTPIIDGQITGNEWNDAGVIESNGCIDQLLDGQPNADGTYSSNLQPGPVTIFTKRDNQNLYFAFTVTDATVVTPNNVNGQAITLGDRIIIQFDPNHSRESVPKNDDFRVELELYRNANAQVDVIWYQGSGDPTNPWQQLAKNPAFIQAKCLSNAAGSSYVAEAQVLLGQGGLGYTLNPNNPADMGIAVAVVNDLKGWIPTNATTEAA